MAHIVKASKKSSWNSGVRIQENELNALGMLEYWNDGVLAKMRPKTLQGFCSLRMVFPIIPIFRPSRLATDSYLLASKTVLYSSPFLRKRIARHSSMAQVSTGSK
jgi:hypothetical protein